MTAINGLDPKDWPRADHEAFQRAYLAGNIFDGSVGPGAHLSEGSREFIRKAYRRWLGFLTDSHPDEIYLKPADRITPERIKSFVGRLDSEVRPTTVSMAVEGIYRGALIIAPDGDWHWLLGILRRLKARAQPSDRFDKLVPAWQVFDHGLELMDNAIRRGRLIGSRQRIDYRDGFMLALVSLWPIRRRSIAALTVSRHIEFDEAGINLHLFGDDNKMNRPESFRLPELLVPYLEQYLHRIRIGLLIRGDHDGLWPSLRGRPMVPQQIYNVFRRRISGRFGRAMSVHDMRRAASTFLAMEAPDMIGIIPSVLQHASEESSDRYYNLARSTAASKRYVGTLHELKSELVELRPER